MRKLAVTLTILLAVALTATALAQPWGGKPLANPVVHNEPLPDLCISPSLRANVDAALANPNDDWPQADVLRSRLASLQLHSSGHYQLPWAVKDALQTHFLTRIPAHQGMTTFLRQTSPCGSSARNLGQARRR